jgi:hypothetical protein
MNKHLKLVREFHDAAALQQAGHGINRHLSDMEIIMHQALLMDGGSEALKALKAGDMAEILAGLTDLGYYALSAIAVQGEDVVERPVLWRNDGFVISVMRLLSGKIDRCAAGGAGNYSEVYCACGHLASSFLNADFDKAFQKVHERHMAILAESGETGMERHLKSYKAPDLNDCLYE